MGRISILTVSMLVGLWPVMGMSETPDGEAISTPLWEVSQAWDDQAETEFSMWVEQMGRARQTRKCLRFKSCLENPQANALHTPGEVWPRLFADCADLPYLLRAYFSWKTERPFQFVSRIHGRRYSKNNRIKEYSDQGDPHHKDMRGFFRFIGYRTHSGFFRFGPEVEGTDTYPIDITREHVRPGTVFYEPRGHVLVVSHMDDDGTVYMFDGHPDNSLTFKTFTEKIHRGPGKRGGGFRNWRWHRMETDAEGNVSYLRETNDEITARGGGYDAQSQYQKPFKWGDAEIDYYTWVKRRLRRKIQTTQASIQNLF
jgi:hypothetical protein